MIYFSPKLLFASISGIGCGLLTWQLVENIESKSLNLNKKKDKDVEKHTQFSDKYKEKCGEASFWIDKDPSIKNLKGKNKNEHAACVMEILKQHYTISD